MKKQNFQLPEGIEDITPENQAYWQLVHKKLRTILYDYGFEKIETPALEQSSLIEKSHGKNSEITEEIFTFKTRGDEELSLRPEGVSGLIRSYIENGMSSLSHPIQLCYEGQFFKQIKPEDGKLRQFHQVGAQLIGDDSAASDAQMIFIAFKALESLGLKNLIVKINTIGNNSCRTQYSKALKDYYRIRGKKICNKCKKYLKDDLLALLSCQEENCKETGKDVPQIVDYLDEDCRSHFRGVLEFLDETKTPYLLEPRLIKEPEFFSQTVFEIWQEEKDGSPALLSPICSGGRHDKLINNLGGHKVPTTGWAIGVERVIMALKQNNILPPDYRSQPKIFIAQLAELAKRKSLLLFEEFRRHGITARASFGKDSIKSQLRIASRYGIKYTLIMGQKESLDGTVIVRETNTGVQETVPIEKVVDLIKQRLRSN